MGMARPDEFGPLCVLGLDKSFHLWYIIGDDKEVKAMAIVNHKQVHKKSRSHHVEHMDRALYRVTSGHSGETYEVRVGERGATCTCPWGTYRPTHDGRSGCSHAVAVFEHEHARASRRVSAWGIEDDALRQRRPMGDIGDGVLLTSRKT